MKKNPTHQPKIVVFSTLFPNPGQPNAGLFIRERMFRVAAQVPLIIVAPVAWFPGQSIIRRFKPHFRPQAPYQEVQQGITVYHPRFFSFPGCFKWLDGYFLALSSYTLLKKIKKEFEFNHIDAHFAYPDGFAATKLAQWFSVTCTITLRGTEIRHSRSSTIGPLLYKSLKRASKVFSVSNSLKKHVVSLGIEQEKVTVIGNGVDTEKFHPLNKDSMRKKLGLKESDQVLITVGGLVERKGFHRVIELMPELIKKHPQLNYLIVGGPSAEGDWTDKLKKMVNDLNLKAHVQFLGNIAPEQLKEILSAADVFVLPTRNEGWANVILEAMACGIPVVATDVGGNSEVINADELGQIVPFGDKKSLKESIYLSLTKKWNKDTIIQYAQNNSWDNRVTVLLSQFKKLTFTNNEKNN